MGIRFRRRVKVCPGLYINFSGSGASLTAGIPGASVNFGSKGAYVNAGIPGTGLYARERISPGKNESPNPEPAVEPIQRESIEFKTHDIDTLTGMEFAETKIMILDAYRRRQEFETHISSARRSLMWLNILRYLSLLFIVGIFWKLPADKVKNKKDQVADLLYQQEDCCVDIDAVFDDEKKRAYVELESAFNEMASSDAIWDQTRSEKRDRVRERTSASAAVERTKVKFQFAKLDVLKSNHDAFRLGNSNGPDIYIYPAFVLFKDKSTKIGLLGYNEIVLEHQSVRFISEQREAHDAEQVDTTWKKVNKNGTPDKRFKGNYQIPIYSYGGIGVTSASGLNESFIISNAKATEKFANAFFAYQNKLSASM